MGATLLLTEAFVETCVDASVSQQLRVCAAFDDAAVVEHQDLIGASNGAESMGDDEGRASFQQDFECFLQS